MKYRHIRLTCLIAVPFAALLVFDLAVLGRFYLDGSNGDNLQLYFSLAYAWLHSHWPPLTHLVIHHPGMPLEFASVLFIALNGLPTEDLSAFAHFAIAFNVCTIALASAWTAWLVVRHDLPIIPIALAACLTAAMPTITAFTTTLVGYYTYGVLLLPIGVGLFVLLSRQERDIRTEIVTLAGLGFALTLNYIAAITIVGVLAAVLASRPLRMKFLSSEPKSRAFQSLKRLGDIAIAVFIFACGSFTLRGILWLTGSAGSYKALLTVLIYIVAAVATAVVVAILRKLPWSSPYMAVGRPVALGWLAGANILALEWPFGAAFAILYRGGNTSGGLSFWEKLHFFNPWPFLIESAWHFVLPGLLVVGIWMLLRSLNRGAPSAMAERALGTMILTIMAIDLASTFDISLLVPRPEYILVSSRFHMSTLAAIPSALLWLYEQKPWSIRVVTGMLVVVVTATTLVQYPMVVAAPTARASERDTQTAAIIDDFLTSHHDGTVLCFATFIPRQCGLAHAWWRVTLINAKFDDFHPERNRVRSISSLTELPDELADGPVLLVSEREAAEISGRAMRQILRLEDFPSLFVYEFSARAR